MELVYTVAKSHRSKRHNFVFRDERPMISLSARNSLALCTTATLTEDKAEQYVVIFYGRLQEVLTVLLGSWTDGTPTCFALFAPTFPTELSQH